jgi:hypothetical protein
MPARSTYEIGGKNYLTLEHAGNVIGPVISKTTLSSWAARCHTPWGLDLEIIPQPISIHAKGHATTTKRSTRLLISEASTLLLKRLLQDYRRHPGRPVKLTNKEIADLRAATNFVQ